jgi:uncharacterized protein YqkB
MELLFETHVSIFYADRMTINTIKEEQTLLKLSSSADGSPRINVYGVKKFVYSGAQDRIKTF